MNFTALTGSVDSILKKKDNLDSVDDDKSFELSGGGGGSMSGGGGGMGGRGGGGEVTSKVGSMGSSSGGGRGVVDIVDDEEGFDIVIPTWKELQGIYEKRWLVKKAKFHRDLRMNFRALVERYATGKQEIFVLSVPDRREHLYREAFLELFESGYAPHVGDAEQLAGKRVRRLFITLPHSFV